MGIRVRKPALPARGPRPPWLVPPRLRTSADGIEERRATWLELFFDLVFVVAIAGLSHELVVDHSAAGFLRFAALFVPVYVAWQGYMAYADRFDTDDAAFRVALFAAMLAIAAMAVLIGDVAHGDHSAGFAVAYVVLRSVMLALYWRAWRAVPEARPLIRRYAGGYGVAVAFTLIVIGESIVAVALETSDSAWRVDSAAAAILGFAAVAGVWWLYFDRQADVVLRGTSPSPLVYSYAHLPLLMV